MNIAMRLGYVDVVISQASCMTYNFFYHKGTYQTELFTLLEKGIPSILRDKTLANLEEKNILSSRFKKTLTRKKDRTCLPKLLILGVDEPDAKNTVLDLKNIQLDRYEIHYWSMSWRSSQQRILETIRYYLALFALSAELKHIERGYFVKEKSICKMLNHVFQSYYLSIDSSFKHGNYFDYGMHNLTYEEIRKKERLHIVEQFSRDRELMILMEYEHRIHANYFYLLCSKKDSSLRLHVSGRYSSLFTAKECDFIYAILKNSQNFIMPFIEKLKRIEVHYPNV